MKKCNIITTIYLPLEVRENILRYTGDNFSNVVKGILGGEDILINYFSIIERITYKKRTTVSQGNTISEILLPCGLLCHSNKEPSYVERNENDMISETRWYMFGMLHNINQPTITSYYDDGRIKGQWWYEYDVIHRMSDLQPAIIKYYDNGSVEEEHWMVNGVYHRLLDKPALIRYYKANDDGGIETTKEEHWFIEGKYPRRDNDAPSVIKWYDDSVVEEECWFVYNKRHRTSKINDLPSMIRYHENGNPSEQRWYKNDNLHRETQSEIDEKLQSPSYAAVKKYYENGQLEEECFFVDNRCHRDGNLPSIKRYNEDGSLLQQYWIVNGIFIKDFISDD